MIEWEQDSVVGVLWVEDRDVAPIGFLAVVARVVDGKALLAKLSKVFVVRSTVYIMKRSNPNDAPYVLCRKVARADFGCSQLRPHALT